ncbi:hypothetical protein GQ44DRAFT_17983 [Phaeosphaeriaceae sp. PMI808]|nr:hypothetical protein GQ44DRAFT_17983 [Phaeosphaeriaceae sp. PMI808]
MGRKKNKKNTQKQVEVATPPESLNTTAPAEEPPANEAPPPEVVSDEVPVESVPDPNPGDSQDNTKESEASLAAETLDHSENTAPESDHMGSSLAVPEEQSTVPATESQELGPTKEEQSTEVLPDQLLEIEAEAHLATEQTSEMSSEIFDIEDASIETPMAQDEIEETAQVEEATAETEPVAAETQLDQEEPSDPSAEIPVENGPAPEIVEELPTEPPEDITPESPIEETSEFVEAQEQLDQDETASAAETPVINDLSSELPPAESSEEKPEEALAVEALEPPIQEDEAPSAPDSEAEAEAEQAEKEQAEKEQAEKEQAEQERLEQERIEQEKFEQEKLEQEKLEQEKLEQEKFEQEKLEQEKLEQEKLEQEKLEQEKLEQEKLEQEKLEQERIEQEMLEAQRVEEERIEKEKVEAAELAQKQALEAEAEATRLAEEKKALEAQTQADAEAEAARIAEEEELKKAASASETAQELVFEADSKPTNLSTPPPEALAEPPTAPSVPANDPVNRLPTPAETVDRSNSPHSVATDASKTKPRASEPSPKAVPAHRSMDANHIAYGRQSSSSPMTAPKPQAVSQLLEESRPPAPSPPIGRVRPRHISTFDSEDDSDSALVRPRRQYRGGEEFARDSSGSGPGYPPQPAHHRSVFASRVPTEPTYSNPPPPQPPGYHPGFYPPTAPPHYPDHNYRMSQPGYSHPNSYGPPSHSSSSPYTESWNYSSGYRHNSPPQRHDTLVSRDYPLGLSPLDQRGDDPGEVFSRIAQAIPDLHVLLARYKETHGQLTVREELLRRSAVEQEEKLRIKDGEIAELRERSHNLEQKYSSEASRLRLQIGNLEEQARELQEQRTETEKYKKEAQDTKTALDAAMRSWEAKYKELEEAHTALARTSAEEKAKAYQDFDEWKSTYTTRNDAEKIALAIQFDKRLKEADVLAENQRQEMATAHVKEKEELRSEHQSRQLERQVSFERIRTELETKLGAAQIDREEALKHERESREVWLAEREGLIKSHQDDRESLRKGWDEHRDLLETQYKKNKDESDKAWMELHADASHKADEEKTRANQLVQEKEELQKSYNALKAESEQEKSIIKSVATNLESEKARLEKLMECYGDIAEIKSKGDTY